MSIEDKPRVILNYFKFVHCHVTGHQRIVLRTRVCVVMLVSGSQKCLKGPSRRFFFHTNMNLPASLNRLPLLQSKIAPTDISVEGFVQNAVNKKHI